MLALQELQGDQRLPTHLSVWQQLNQLARRQARVTQGALMPIHEAFVASTRPQGSLDARFGWAAIETLLSPAGNCAVLLDPLLDLWGLQIVQLASDAAAALQLPAAGQADSPAVAVGFSDSGGLLGLIRLEDTDDGGLDVVFEWYDCGDAEWSTAGLRGQADDGTVLYRMLHFAFDQSLAACALLDEDQRTSVLVFSVQDSSFLEQLPLHPDFQSADLVSLLWLPGRHTLLVAFSCGVGTINAGLEHCQQSPRDRTKFLFFDSMEVLSTDVAPIITLVKHGDTTRALQLCVVCTEQAPDGSLRVVAYGLTVGQPVPESSEVPELARMHGVRWDGQSRVTVRQVQNSTALCYSQGAMGVVVTSSKTHVWPAKGLMSPVWSPGHLPGYFLAGIRSSEVVVLDREGTTVANWQPVRRQGGSSSGLSVVQPLRVKWVGAGRQQLAVSSGLGRMQDGVWPAVLVTLLDFQ